MDDDGWLEEPVFDDDTSFFNKTLTGQTPKQHLVNFRETSWDDENVTWHFKYYEDI